PADPVADPAAADRRALERRRRLAPVRQSGRAPVGGQESAVRPTFAEGQVSPVDSAGRTTSFCPPARLRSGAGLRAGKRCPPYVRRGPGVAGGLRRVPVVRTTSFLSAGRGCDRAPVGGQESAVRPTGPA